MAAHGSNPRTTTKDIEARAVDGVRNVGCAFIRMGRIGAAHALFYLVGEEMPQSALVALGDRLLEERDYENATNAYISAGRTLPQYAERYPLEEKANAMFYAYALAGKPVPAELLALHGMHLLQSGKYARALDAFTEAAVGDPRVPFLEHADTRIAAGEFAEALTALNTIAAFEQIVALGALALEMHKLDVAQDAFASAGMDIPHDAIEGLCMRLLGAGDIDGAMRAYALTGSPMPNKLLVHFGTDRLRAGQVALAKQAFGAARTPIPPALLRACADHRLEQGDIAPALEMYALAELPLPVAKLIATGDRLRRRRKSVAALAAYRAAQASDRLVELGAQFLKEGRVEHARDAFTAAFTIERQAVSAQEQGPRSVREA